MKKAIVVGAVVVVLAAAAIGVYMWRSSSDSNDVTAAVDDQSQRTLKSDPASIEARRQQYLAQYQQLWRVDDYATVRKKAQDGNPIAQRRLYEIYEHCMGMQAADTLPLLNQLTGVNKEIAAAMREMSVEYQRVCGRAGAGNEASGKARAFWMRQSAKSGDLVSEMRVRAGESALPITLEQMQDFIQRTAITGDPVAIMEIGSLLPRLKEPWPDQATAAAMNGTLAEHAWIIAACRAGMDCNRGSRLMTTVCIRVMSCNRQNYEAFIYADLVSVNKRPQIEVLVAIIQQRLLKPKQNV
jgi:hypothetical protein